MTSIGPSVEERSPPPVGFAGGPSGSGPELVYDEVQHLVAEMGV